MRFSLIVANLVFLYLKEGTHHVRLALPMPTMKSRMQSGRLPERVLIT